MLCNSTVPTWKTTACQYAAQPMPVDEDIEPPAMRTFLQDMTKVDTKRIGTNDVRNALLDVVKLLQDSEEEAEFLRPCWGVPANDDVHLLSFADVTQSQPVRNQYFDYSPEGELLPYDSAAFFALLCSIHSAGWHRKLHSTFISPSDAATVSE